MSEKTTMNVKRRLEDISARSGVPEHVVRRVIEAECDSLAASLKRGERSTLLGRCTIVPTESFRIIPGLDENGNVRTVKRICLKAVPSKSLEKAIETLSDEEVSTDDYYDIPRLATIQIEGLV